MKTKLLSILIAVLVVACGTPDKQKELDKLRKERDVLTDKIKLLEEAIAKDSGYVTDIGTRVNLKEIQTSLFEHCIEVQGKIDGDQSVSVFTEGAGGMIKEIIVKEGQQVNKGQVLAVIDDKIYQATLKSNQSNLDYVTTMYNKQKNLWDQKIGSEMQYLDIKTKKESLESAIVAIQEQIDMCKIKAPIDGTIEDLPIKIGQLVGPGIITARIVNLKSLKIMADLAEGYSNRVKKGDNVKIILPDLKKELIGNVDFSSRYINPINRTFSISIRITSDDKSIKANMVAIVRITDYSNPNAIVVPINLVQTDLEGQYIVIAENSGNGYVAKKARVSQGEVYNGKVEIKSGLNAGDKIITAGYLDIENGQAISF